MSGLDLDALAGDLTAIRENGYEAIGWRAL